jgi:GT2 family glycosyltransferase
VGKDLSIIIVSYNVSPFLKLCLYSVEKAARKVDAEIFVVDNASGDDSVRMVKENFPGVELIENKKNTGFSSANNIAIKKASGKYILLLNPDTIIGEDTFEKLLEFYERTPDATGVGVRMIDGSGRFLPESKRGLPTLSASFFKFSGLVRIFPDSKKIAAYYAGNVGENETAPVPVLAGAFFAFPGSAVEKAGLLDETFFMYGEDIDLSYRLSRLGNNYYYPEIKIIHFKGESTIKDAEYIERFYNAMLIFAEKHFFSNYGKLRRWLVKASINGMKGFMKLLINFKKDGKTAADMNITGSCYMGDNEGYDVLKNKIRELRHIKELRQGDGCEIFADMSSVSLSGIIEAMNGSPGRAVVRFISPSRDFYLTSINADGRGEVTYL